MNKKIIHDALILTAFTLILGFILGTVYNITKGPIKAAEEQTALTAYKAVYKEADSFKKHSFDKNKVNKIVSKKGYNDVIDDIQEAKGKDGKTIGYVITVTAKDGSQGSITFSVGIKNDGTINGYSITASSETPGLGLKASEKEFSKQFNNKKVDKLEVVKQKPSQDNEIEAITGATITSKAVSNGCNSALVVYKNLKGGKV
ncbi:RnfABCDGE type electron transport complex subunit G [Lachnobacterium bovis]|jgi:electron transport complex protein RnfG|uniref:Ion-translocating oxidoreductase complex subunit G n=1 Tax=Lachnobacterium bovis DSM 14045 TaxID=1122142 RepID=A0A1H3FPM7_9FIRM|nr:RnfABCDGE type electron transport complex subunit G [Lachnobacterium bovis]MBQ1801388.1 RnfABCDGE type electron transport complex subunit G [Lachnobacterium sp.]SDX92835.1 electron transport complex protein RnfG [Lachnobacterium bovis DSM 14045]